MKTKLTKLLLLFTVIFSSLFFILYQENTLEFENSDLTFVATQNNDDIQKFVIESIEKAKSSIYIQIFSLKDKRIIQALEKKAHEGIRVEIIYDAKNGISINLDPKIISHPKTSKGLMHRKILIIDSREVILGSANFTRSSLRMHDNLVVKISSSDLAEFIIKNNQNKHPNFSRNFIINNQVLELWLTPEDKEAESRILSLIESAKKSIKVAMFTFTNKKITSALIEAKKRGVDVEIVIEKSSFDAEKILNKFKSKAVDAKLSKKPVLLHHKFALIDDSILILGSANWTYSAFYINDDDFIIIHDMTDSQKRYLEKLWKKIILEAL